MEKLTLATSINIIFIAKVSIVLLYYIRLVNGIYL